RLRGSGIDIARRTVAKYREAMRIPSSVQRRRDKEWVTINSRASAISRRPPKPLIGEPEGDPLS
ncbi:MULTISPECIES: hypothetical protein, partial [unclassified Bradyrhizobium]|uniref:RNA polymerase factor sigma-54 n=1 Tax=unclassified Bradyrhizobium TaxID=2631580 RepID=UPI001FF722D1